MAEASMDPAALLGETMALRQRSRSIAHEGAWLPALVLAALPVVSTALYRAPFTRQVNVWVQLPFKAGLPATQHSTAASYAFWLVVGPVALAVVALWYRRRAGSRGVRVAWQIPVAAGGLGFGLVLALLLSPVPRGHWSAGYGLLTPLLCVAAAAVALGVVERSKGITLSGVWMGTMAWQFCALGRLGGIFGWQASLLGGGSGPGLGGRVTLLGLDRPLPALLLMSLPLAVVGVARRVRSGA